MGYNGISVMNSK